MVRVMVRVKIFFAIILNMSFANGIKLTLYTLI